MLEFPHAEYKASLGEERQLREEIFLGVNTRICGIEIQEITPFLLARLFRMETPFLSGRTASRGEIVRFLWALCPWFVGEPRKYPRSNFWRKLTFRKPLSPFATRDAFVEDVTKSLDGRWGEAEESIDLFIRNTFMDAPKSGGESVPYVTGIAWMLFVMAGEPFRWSEEKTLHTPLRKSYQLSRCIRISNGGILYNDISDKVKARWLDEVNARGRN